MLGRPEPKFLPCRFRPSGQALDERKRPSQTGAMLLVSICRFLALSALLGACAEKRVQNPTDTGGSGGADNVAGGGTGGGGDGGSAGDNAGDNQPEFLYPVGKEGQHNYYPRAVTVDDTQVYWADLEGVRKGPKTGGGNVTTLGPWGGELTPHLINVDATHIYYLHNDHINKIPKAGGATEELPLGVDLGLYGTMTADDTYLYFAETECLQIGRMTKMGVLGELSVGAPGNTGSTTQLIVTDTTLYCANAQTIWAQPKMGGKVEVFVDGFTSVVGVVIHADTMYFGTDDSPGSQYLSSIPIAGGVVTRLGTLNKPGGPGNIHFDALRRSLFWRTSIRSYDAELYSYSLESGIFAPVTPYKIQLGNGFDADADYLYWGDGHAIMRIRKPPLE